MTEQEKRTRIKALIEELMQLYEKIDIESLDEKRESEIHIEIDKLSPDPEWGNYIGGNVKDENGNFVSETYFDDPDNIFNLNYDKFLDKIFSYQPIIMGYTPIIDTKEDKEN